MLDIILGFAILVSIERVERKEPANKTLRCFNCGGVKKFSYAEVNNHLRGET